MSDFTGGYAPGNYYFESSSSSTNNLALLAALADSLSESSRPPKKARLIEKQQQQKDDLRWKYDLARLKVYKVVHGDCCVTREYTDEPDLHLWVDEQRRQYRLYKEGNGSTLTPERVAALQELNFCWLTSQDQKWFAMVERLKAYKTLYNDCLVPPDYEDKELVDWVADMREQYMLYKRDEESTLTEERIALLDKMAFVWNIRDEKSARWLMMYERLKEYKELNGDTCVPRSFSSDNDLASWVSKQRRLFKLLQEGKKSAMTPIRLALLKEIDFAWDAREASWSRHFAALKAFYDEQGHFCLSKSHPEQVRLTAWIAEQRQQYKMWKQGKPSTLTQERIDELDGIGFWWTYTAYEADFMEGFRDMLKYKETHGHLRISTKDEEHHKLVTWVNRQRVQYTKLRQGKPCCITEDRVKAVERLGFTWPKVQGSNKN